MLYWPAGTSRNTKYPEPFVMAFGDRVTVERGTWLESAIPQLRALGHAQVAAREAPVKANAVLHTAQGWQSARDPRVESQLSLP